eukprot:637908_1
MWRLLIVSILWGCTNPFMQEGLSGASYFSAKDILHGEMVAIGTVVHLFIEKNWDEMMRVAKFFKSVDLPVCIDDVCFNTQNVKDFDQQMENALDITMGSEHWFRDNMQIKITRQMVKDALTECNKLNQLLGVIQDMQSTMNQLY